MGLPGMMIQHAAGQLTYSIAREGSTFAVTRHWPGNWHTVKGLDLPQLRTMVTQLRKLGHVRR